MPTYVPPKRGAAYTFYTALTSQADTKLHKVNPTLASGDVKVSLDGGAFANLSVLPDVEPDGSAAVRVQLSSDEMAADTVVVRFSDVAGAEWCDQMIVIQTASQQIDDLAVPGDEMDLVDAPNATAITAIQSGLAVPGDEMALTTSERSSIVSAVWNALTSAMTTVGSIGKLLVEKMALIISGAQITVTSPVTEDGDVDTIQGDDYLHEDGRALSWTVSSSATLTGGVATAVIKGVASFTATIVSETLIRLELTRAQSATINAGYHGYSLFVTQTDGDKITLARGTWHSSAAHTA